jgi:hypothetical protein
MHLGDRSVWRLDVARGILVVLGLSASTASVYSSGVLGKLGIVLGQNAAIQLKPSSSGVFGSVGSEDENTEWNRLVFVVQSIHKFQRIIQSNHAERCAYWLEVIRTASKVLLRLKKRLSFFN